MDDTPIRNDPIEHLGAKRPHRRYRLSRTTFLEALVSRSFRDEVTRHLKAMFAAVAADLTLDANGIVAIAFEGDREVQLEVPEHGTLIYAHAPLTATRSSSPALLAKALELNFFQIRQPHTWISLDPETSMLTLCATCSAAELQAGNLESFFLSLLNNIDELSHLLTAAETARGADDSEQFADHVLFRA